VSALDGACLVVLLASLLLGAWRGLLYEVLAIAGWVVAFLAARWLAETVGRWLPLGQTGEPVRYAVGFALVFIAVAFACGMLASLARRAAKSLGMRPVDRAFGAAFGITRGLLLLLALDVLALMTPLHEAEWWRASVSAHWLDTALMQCLPLLPPALGKYLSA
jgi:membrane protein required for colicin V production